MPHFDPVLYFLQKSHKKDAVPIWVKLEYKTFNLRSRKGALAIRRIFSLVDMITKPKFSNCPNVFKIGLFR